MPNGTLVQSLITSSYVCVFTNIHKKLLEGFINFNVFSQLNNLLGRFRGTMFPWMCQVCIRLFFAFSKSVKSVSVFALAVNFRACVFCNKNASRDGQHNSCNWSAKYTEFM